MIEDHVTFELVTSLHRYVCSRSHVTIIKSLTTRSFKYVIWSLASNATTSSRFTLFTTLFPPIETTNLRPPLELDAVFDAVKTYRSVTHRLRCGSLWPRRRRAGCSRSQARHHHNGTRRVRIGVLFDEKGLVQVNLPNLFSKNYFCHFVANTNFLYKSWYLLSDKSSIINTINECAIASDWYSY